MISHVFVAEQNETIRVSHFVRYLLINGTASVKNFERDNWTEVADYLKESTEKYRDVRVYLIAAENVHFAYELPFLESKEDIAAVVKLRLKKDLLFPVSQFLFSLSFEIIKKRTSVQVCGIKSSVIASLRKAFALADVDIHRIYMRDQLTMEAFKGLWLKEHAASFVIADGGFLLLSNDASRQQIFRFSPRTSSVSDGDLQSDDRLTGSLLRTLNRVGCSGKLFVEDALTGFFDSYKGAEVKPMSSLPAEDIPDYGFLREKPALISQKTPFCQIVSEDELGFHPTKAHGVALIVALWLIFSLFSLWSEDSLLSGKEANLMAASNQIEKAEQTRKKCEKQLAELDYVKDALGLFNSEIYSTLNLIQNVSQCRKGSVKIATLKPSESTVEIGCFAANEEDAFAFVAALSKISIAEKVTLKGINFTEARQVNFTVELIRNG